MLLFVFFGAEIMQGRIQVDDQRLWELGTVQLKHLYAGFSDETRQALTNVMLRYRKVKESHAAVVGEADASILCRNCCGQCCMNGKYRINVLDYLSRLIGNVPTSVDFMHKPLCPYGTDAGCTMDAGLRPADCVAFICEAIDACLSQKARLQLGVYEQEMRECLREASRLAGVSMGTPVLLWADTVVSEKNYRCKG